MLVFTTATISFAQGIELRVADGTITSAIKNQLPVDSVESYRADFGKLFCFTRIMGAQEDTEVTHVWYYQDAELARVTLPVRSSDWRTYSSKRFLPQWAGQWRVAVLDVEGNEIATIPFLLE
jgi:hypothetical protein